MTDARTPRTAADFDTLRAEAGGDPRWQALVDRDELVELAHAMLDKIPPCPQWCTVGAGHPYDLSDGAHVRVVDGDVQSAYLTDDPIALLRFHYSDGLDDGAAVSQEERNEAGTVTLGPILTWVAEYELPFAEVDAAGARQRAAEMRQQADRIALAADMLDAITGADGG